MDASPEESVVRATMLPGLRRHSATGQCDLNYLRQS
jgi:hypothetical protein